MTNSTPELPQLIHLQLTEQQFYDIINILGLAPSNVSFFAVQDLKRQGDHQALALQERRNAAAMTPKKAVTKAKAPVKAKALSKTNTPVEAKQLKRAKKAK